MCTRDYPPQPAGLASRPQTGTIAPRGLHPHICGTGTRPTKARQDRTETGNQTGPTNHMNQGHNQPRTFAACAVLC